MIETAVAANQNTPDKSSGAMILLGAFLGAHALRGLVKVKSFTANPRDLVQYQPLTDETGRNYQLRLVSSVNDRLIVAVDGITNRDAAELLIGKKLFVARDLLADLPDENEFYHADLLGCVAIDEAGLELGRVAAIHEFGAGDLLEISPDSKEASFMLPFTHDVVPIVALEKRQILVRRPTEITERDQPV